MTDSELLFPEAEDPEVTNEQLGAIVRTYRGISRPPEIIVARTSGLEKGLLVCVFFLLFVALLITYISRAETLKNRSVSYEVQYLVCARLEEQPSYPPNAEVARICAEVLSD